MATKEHGNDAIKDDIVGYTGYATQFYGYKLLLRVYIAEANSHVWLGQYGSAKDNKWVPSADGKDIQVLTDKVIKNDYTLTWTPDEEFKKGDVLVGNTKDGARIVLIYISDQHIERLTPFGTGGYSGNVGYGTLSYYKSELSDSQIERLTPFDNLSTTGHGTLKFYQGELKNLQVLKTALDKVPFSSK